ncbi:MAG: hypothetical protein AAF413_03970 [Patescibacteria group bacterium]
MAERKHANKPRHESAKAGHETKESIEKAKHRVHESLKSKSHETKPNTTSHEKHHAKEASEKAKNAHEVAKKLHEHVSTKEHEPRHSNHALRTHSFARIMASTRRQLGPVDRVFSKVIHNPIVDQVSDGLGKTVFRPSGVIGAGLVSFIGMSIVLYYARTTGFRVSPGLFVVLIGAGFLVGWITEALLGFKNRALK